MKIRKFRPEDAAELARMHRTTIRKINSKDYNSVQIAGWSARTTAKKFRKSMSTFIRFVAVDKGEIVGFGDFTKKGELSGLYIHHKYIGEGVGKKILLRLEKTAVKMGVKKFKVTSTVTAKNFYQNQGYKTVRKSIFKRGKLRFRVYKMGKVLAK